MMQKSILIAVIALLVIAGLILFGPGLEKKAPETLVFEKSWDIIEYKGVDPAEWEKSVSEADEKAKKEKNYKAADRELQKSRERENILPKRFIRDSGFFSDSYFVETGAGTQAVRRRGGYTVKNIFSDWSKLRYTAVYPVSDTDLPKFGPYADLVELTKSGKSTLVRIGRKHTNGNQFIRVESEEHKGRVYLIQGYLADRFRAQAVSFREKRILTYPTDSYTEKLNITLKNGSRLNFRAEKAMKDNAPIFKWFDESGTELAVNMVTPIDNLVKMMEIARFRDEPEVQAAGDPDASWSSTGADDLRIEAKVKGGDSYVIQIRKLPAPPSDKSRNLHLIKASVESGAEYVDAAAVENLERQIEMFQMTSKKPAEKPTNPGTEQPVQ